MNLNNVYISQIAFGAQSKIKLVLADSKDNALSIINDFFPDQIIFCILSVTEVLDLREKLETKKNDKSLVWYYFDPIIDNGVFSADVLELFGKKEELLKVHNSERAIWFSYEQMIIFLDALMYTLSKASGDDFIFNKFLMD